MTSIVIKRINDWAATAACASFSMLFYFWAAGYSSIEKTIQSLDKASINAEQQEVFVGILVFLGNSYLLGVMSILFGLWAMASRMKWQGLASLPFVGLTIYVFYIGASGPNI